MQLCHYTFLLSHPDGRLLVDKMVMLVNQRPGRHEGSPHRQRKTPSRPTPRWRSRSLRVAWIPLLSGSGLRTWPRYRCILRNA